MRLSPAFLALVTALTACNLDDDDGFADQVTNGLGGSESGEASTSDGPPPGTTTDDTPTTGAPDDSTTDVPDLTTTSDATTTGLTDPSTSDATTSDATTTDTTGAPADDCPRVRVTVAPGDVLNVRPTPSTAEAPLGTLPPGAIVDVIELVQGEVLEGNGGWYQIHSPGLDGYVWSGLVECTLDEPNMDGFFLPLECGKMAKISQGNFGDFSHQGQSAYAFDFSVPLGTPLVAIADGTVAHMYNGTKPGDPCYNGGGKECNNAANYVSVLHNDGTRSIYAHLSETFVAVGEKVPRGVAVGKSGSTGWSTGPHAHVARTENCNSSWCQSIAVSFTDVPGDGVPDTNDIVTSMNCP